MMTESHVAQASLKLSVYSNLTLALLPLPSAGTIGIFCHSGFYAARAQVQKSMHSG